LLVSAIGILTLTACGGAQPPDFRDLDQLESGGGVAFGGEEGKPGEGGEEGKDEAAAAAAGAGDSVVTTASEQPPQQVVPWQFGSDSTAGEEPDESTKPPSVELPVWVRDPMTLVTDRERRMAALSVVTYGKTGAELDRILATRGLDRAQAVAEYRALADEHDRGGPYTEQMYEYQSWVVQGETVPEF